MPIIIELECIGHNWGLSNKEVFLTRMFLGAIPSRAWVAEITGFSPRYGYERVFVQRKTDYTHANSKATRGVIAIFVLKENRIYEVSDPRSWKRTERYFCRVEDGEIVRMSKEEVDEWLRSRSELTSTTPPASE